jgi:SPP1 gp7 family putative phage head morphogenesis protein
MGRATKKITPALVRAHGAKVPRRDATEEDDVLLDVSDEASAQLLDQFTTAYSRMEKKVVKANGSAMRGLGLDVREGDEHLQGMVRSARERSLSFIRQHLTTYAQDVRDIITDPDNFGLSAKEIAAQIEERAGVAASRAETVARDQTLRFNRELTKERHRDAGVTQFEWSTSMDERVRPEHQALEGKVFDWANPPEEIDDINCRCTQVPIIPNEDNEDSA